jgi:hypothetical protein
MYRTYLLIVFMYMITIRTYPQDVEILWIIYPCGYYIWGFSSTLGELRHDTLDSGAA